MKINYVIYLWFVFALGIIKPSAAQEWSVQLEEPVKWVSLSQTGVVMAFTEGGLYGVDPENQEVKWKNPEVSNVKEEGVEYLNTAPLAVLKTITGKTWLVNTYTGALLFNSEDYNFSTVNQRHLCLEEGVMLIDGNGNDDRTLVAVDYEAEGKVIWKQIIGEKKNLVSAAKLTPTPVEIGEYVFLAADNVLLKIHKTEGTIAWKKELKKDIALLFEFNNNIYAVQGNVTAEYSSRHQDDNEMSSTTYSSLGNFLISGYDSENGSELWDPVKVKGSFAGLRILEEGALIFSDGGTLPKIDLETGEEVWKNPPGLRASWVNNIETTEKGYLISVLSVNANMIAYIGYDGETIDKGFHMTTSPIDVMKNLDQGIFVLGDDFDLLTHDKKKSIWGKELKDIAVSAYTRDDKGNYYVVTQSGSLYYLDLEAVAYKKLAGGLPVTKDRINNFELSGGALFISMSQGIVKVDTKEGQVIWRKQYPEVELSLGAQMLLFSISTTADLLSAANQIGSNIYSLSSNPRDKTTAKVLQAKSNLASGVAAETYKLINTRFSARQESGAYVVFLTKNPDNNKVSFVIVDKNDGSERFVTVDDSTPKFTLDSVERLIYFVKDNQSIEAHSFGQ